MIIKTVNVPVEALARIATEAQVKDLVDGVYVFDLYDAEGLVAFNRYALPANAPFTLTQEEIDALVEPVEEL
jgi:hypothetical protein